jgi:preprotein translocase subunit SecG
MLDAILLVLHIIISILLILSVLMQPGRGEGLSEALGVGSTQKFFGAQTNVVLAKITAILAGLFLISSLVMVVAQKNVGTSLMQNREGPISTLPLTRDVKTETGAPQQIQTEQTPTEVKVE